MSHYGSDISLLRNYVNNSGFFIPSIFVTEIACVKLDLHKSKITREHCKTQNYLSVPEEIP
jgi:hypothetical protein